MAISASSSESSPKNESGETTPSEARVGWQWFGCPPAWLATLGQQSLQPDETVVVFGPLWEPTQIHGELKNVLGQPVILLRSKAQLATDPPWGQQGLLAMVVLPDETTAPIHQEWQHALSVARFVAQQQAEEEKARQRAAQVEDELYTTRQLQQSLLPECLPDADGTAADLSFQVSRTHYRHDGEAASGVEIQGFYIPCDTLGGDYYDVMHHEDGTVSLLVADVSGHGITAAFVTSILKALFYQACRLHPSPDAMLTFMNNQLAKILKTGAYVTAVAARLVPQATADSGWALEYSIAGHPYPMVANSAHKADPEADDGCLRLQNNGFALAWFEGADFELATQPLSKGDTVVLFTDGPTEMVNPADEIYGEERLQASFVDGVAKEKAPLLDFMLQDLSDFTCGMPLNDDLSMMQITISS